MGSVPLSSRLEGIPPYIPGRRPKGTEDGRLARLASNESPWQPQAAVVEAMRAAVGDVNRYPDMEYVELRLALARVLGEPADRIAVGNGSTAVLRDIVAALVDPASEVIFAQPSFPFYRTAILGSGGVPTALPLHEHAHDLDAMRSAITEQTRVIVVCNPNNPTGTAFKNVEVEKFLRRVPRDVAVVLDEAYVEFADDVDGVELARRFDNVIVTRTLSKAHGLAGIRVGYAVGDARLIEAISRLGVPFRIDVASAAGAIAALQPSALAETSRRVSAIVEERDRLTRALRSANWPVITSSANFVFLPLGDASVDFARECASRGVLVRRIGGGVRITVGTPEDTDQIVAAIPALVASG